MAVNTLGSILTADFGNVRTRVNLLDQVDGVYRVVASGEALTTIGFPINDASIGLSRAMLQIEEGTGRRMVNRDGRLISPEDMDRSGVDVVVATATIGRPLRTVLIGLVPVMSVISGQRATEGTYVELIDTLTLDDNRTAQDQMNAIILARPDLLFIVGGTEAGAEDAVIEAARPARLAAALMPRDHRPLVVYAGNSQIASGIEAFFENIAQVFIADNVRPSVDIEMLDSAQAQLATAYDSLAGRTGAGFGEVGALSRVGIQPTAQSSSLIAEYFGATAGDTLVVDVGSATSTIAASVRGVASTSIRTDIGLGHSAPGALRAAGIDAVRRWLPFEASDAEIIGYALNKSGRPGHVPETLRALYLEHALLRAALRELLNGARPAWTPDTAFDDPNAPLPPLARLIGAGAGLAATGRPGMTAMLMLDAMQPLGGARLLYDPTGLIAGLGALARFNPEIVVQILDAGAIPSIGMSYSLSGIPRAGVPAVEVTMTREGGARERFVVDGGAIGVFPLAMGERAAVTVRAVARGASFGGRGRIQATIDGGDAGLIIDTRGRPLPLALDVAARADQMAAWMAQATGDALRPIPLEWLDSRTTATERPSGRLAPRRATGEAAAVPTLADAAAAAPARAEKVRLGRRGGRRRGAQAGASVAADIPLEAAPAARNDDQKEDLDDLRNLFS